MSQIEAYRGRLIPVDLQGKSVEEWVQITLGTSQLPEGYQSWLEALAEETTKHRYLWHPSTEVLYRVEREAFDPESFVHSSRNSDGSIDFSVGYYNGGVGFSEVAAAAVERASAAS